MSVTFLYRETAEPVTTDLIASVLSYLIKGSDNSSVPANRVKIFVVLLGHYTILSSLIPYYSAHGIYYR